ncbi:MAG TPA: hypothetical protein VGB46_06190 [Flavisolibacter sp.]|jgi:hypothetical protein
MNIKKRTEPPQDIQLGSASRVFLTITIGNAQIGGSIVQFKDAGQPLAKGTIIDLDMGPASALAGRTLLVQTNVLDSNASINRIVFTHLFHDEQGNQLASFQIKDQVDNDGDILSSLATYNFQS